MKLLLAATIAVTTAGYVATAEAQTTPAPPPSNMPAGMTPSEKNAQLALEKAGYTQVSNVKSGPKGIAAKAMKDGKEVSVVVDPMGKIEELPPSR